MSKHSAKPYLAARNRARRRSVEDRFNEKHTPEPNSGCWIWTAAVGSWGYGRLEVGVKETGFWAEPAHRVSYQIHRGKIPEGLHVLHKCDTPLCVNPDHLFVGTPRMNTADMVAKGRHAHGDRHWTRNRPEDMPRGDSHWTRRTPERLRPRKGVDSARAKLTEEAVLSIFNDKRSSTLIAVEHGICFGAVCAIRRGKSWAHLTRRKPQC